MNGRENAGGGEQVLSVLMLVDATLTEPRVRFIAQSPALAFGRLGGLFTTFDEDPAQNGLWLTRTDPASGERPQMLPREAFRVLPMAWVSRRLLA